MTKLEKETAVKFLTACLNLAEANANSFSKIPVEFQSPEHKETTDGFILCEKLLTHLITRIENIENEV